MVSVQIYRGVTGAVKRWAAENPKALFDGFAAGSNSFYRMKLGWVPCVNFNCNQSDLSPSVKPLTAAKMVGDAQ